MIYTHEIAFPSEVKKAVLKVSFFSFVLLTQIVRKSRVQQCLLLVPSYFS